MLTVVGVAPTARGGLRIDDPWRKRYPEPVSFEVDGRGYRYWESVSDDGRQLLEVAFDWDTGRVIRVVLVLPGRQDLRPSSAIAGVLDAYASVPCVPGLPVVDQSGFSDEHNVVEEVGGFTLAGVGRTLYVVLRGEVVPDRCIRCDRFGFFVGTNLLCGFAFFDLKYRERLILEERVFRRA